LEAKEVWSEYRLADGTVLRIKPVMIAVSRLEGEHTLDGDPVYNMKSTLVTDLRAAQELKKSATFTAMAIHGKSNAWATRVSCSSGPMSCGRTDDVLARNALVPVPIFVLGFNSSGANANIGTGTNA